MFFSSRQNFNKQFWLLVVFLFLPFVATYAKSPDFNTMLSALRQNVGPIIRLVVATAYVTGLWFIISAIQQLKTIGQSQQTMQQHTLGGPLIKFIVGLMLLYLPSVIDISVWTIWGHSAMGSAAEEVMSYNPSPGPYSQAKEGAIALVRVVGYVSFVRGLIVLSHAGSTQSAQPGSIGKGIIHMIGGILAINIVETIRIIGNTLGISTI